MACPPSIRVTTMPSRNMKIIANEKGDAHFFGIQGRILDLILKAMKVKFKLVIAEDGEWGHSLSNGTWTGMIGKIQKDEADIAINEIIVTPERSAVVEFSSAYSFDKTVFAIRKPEAVPIATALIRSFDISVWILTIMTLLFIPFFIKCFCNTKGTYIHITINLLGSLLGQSEKNKPTKSNSLKHKIIMYFWWIFAGCWSCSFSAALSSVLSVPLEIKPVLNFKELSDVVAKGSFKCFVAKGSATLDVLLYSDLEYLRNLGQIIVNNSWYSNNEPLTKNHQIARHSALVGAKNDLRRVAGPEGWKLNFLSEDSIRHYQAAIAMKKGYCYKQLINTLVDRFKRAGLFQKILKDYHFRSYLTSPHLKIATEDGKPLCLDNLKGAFGLYLLGMIMSLIVFIVETGFSRFLKCKM